MTAVWDVAPHPDATARGVPGAFREHDIQAFRGGMTPPTWPVVAAEVDGWIDRANSIEPRTTGFPEQLADLHAAFERIHPFLDGNGREARSDDDSGVRGRDPSRRPGCADGTPWRESGEVFTPTTEAHAHERLRIDPDAAVAAIEDGLDAAFALGG